MSGQSEAMVDMSPWPIRSFLYVPAIQQDWVSKAIKAGPDAVILDLEDSVGPNEKAKALALVPAGIEKLYSQGVCAFVRPNAMASGGIEDILACVRPGLSGIVLPKASADDVQRAHDALSYAEGKAGLRHGELCILALPETADGVRSGYEIAKASLRVRGLIGGAGTIEGDVAWACGFRPTVEGHEQLYFQSKIILDSRAAGALYPIAGVFSPRTDDLAQLEVFIRRAKTLGFTGAAVIHPSHVAVANRIFQSTPEEVAHYEGLIAALEEGHRRGDGAVKYKGAMVDLAMLPIARDVVAESKRRKLGS
jgi:citrate lyase subunit beta / citryl-CoA lyase